MPKEERIPIEAFYKTRETSDQLLEYIDGIVYMSPFPSTKHRRISMRLSSTLFSFLREKSCEVFSTPFDVELKWDRINESNVVIPDLSVICDKRADGRSVSFKGALDRWGIISSSIWERGGILRRQ